MFSTEVSNNCELLNEWKKSWNVNDLELIQKIFHCMLRNFRLRYISLLSRLLLLCELVFDFYWTRTQAFLIEYKKNEEIVFCFKKGENEGLE